MSNSFVDLNVQQTRCVLCDRTFIEFERGAVEDCPHCHRSLVECEIVGIKSMIVSINPLTGEVTITTDDTGEDVEVDTDEG